MQEFTSRESTRLFLVLWAPLALWWLALLPGGMSTDSMESWGQIVTGRWGNHHPAPYTAFMWLTSLGGVTPATTSLAQTILVAYSVCVLVRSLTRLGLPRRTLTASAFALGALPLLGPFSVTLWKDVPETALLILLAGLSLRLLNDLPPSRRDVLTLAGIAFGAALFRWNGGLTDVLLALLLVAVLRERRVVRVAAAIGGAGIAGFVVLSLIPRVAPVEPPPVVDAAAEQLADIAQFAVHDAYAFRPADKRAMGSVASFERWQVAGRHSCETINPVTVNLIGMRYRIPALTPQLPALKGLWLRLAVQHPKRLLLAHLCRARLAWLPIDMPSSPAMTTVWPTVDANVYGLHPLMPAPLHDAAAHVAWINQHKVVQDVFWRPSLWLLLALALGITYHRRSGQRPRLAVLYLAVPLAVVLSYAAYPAAQDARYCYAAVLLAQLGALGYGAGLLARARKPR